MIRILLVDDHPVARVGIRAALASSIKDVAVADAPDAKSALKQVCDSEWDVMIADISLPGMSGLELISEVRRLKPVLPILALSMHSPLQFGRRALNAGATGYLSKGSDLKEFVTAIYHVLRGRRYMSPGLGGPTRRRTAMWELAPHETLSNREYQVLRLLGAGKNVSEIARDMGLSCKTVSTYRARVLGKFGMRFTAELVRYAIENKLVE